MVYSLEQTPTWAVAAVCTLIVLVSLTVERLINLLGKKLKDKKQKPLYEALEKMKGELMVMGFISLLLTVFQKSITSFCMPESFSHYMLPCPYIAPVKTEVPPAATHTRKLLSWGFHSLVESQKGSSPCRRSLLAWGVRRLEETQTGATPAGVVEAVTCPAGKVPIVSLEGLHQLHIFIFVMTIVHVAYSCVTVFLGFYKMHGWKSWEEETRAEKYDSLGALRKTFKIDRTKTFVAAARTRHPLSCKNILSWFVSFFRQFGTAVVKSDYLTLRMGFISTHKLSPTFDFHSYMRRTIEDDFRVVVGISSSLWAFVVVFLLLNVHRILATLMSGSFSFPSHCIAEYLGISVNQQDWYSYFWIAFIPVALILVVGTKLQHIIQQLSLETAQSHGVIGLGYVQARDSLFWFNRPQILLYLIHFILFQNAFELAFFFWILTTFGFDSCVMGKAWLVAVRLVIGIAVQLLCSYSTLPLYALVTQMGSHYKKAIFNEGTTRAIRGWHNKAKLNQKNKVLGKLETVKSGDHEQLLESQVSRINSPSEGSVSDPDRGSLSKEEGAPEVFPIEVIKSPNTQEQTSAPSASRWSRAQKLENQLVSNGNYNKLDNVQEHPP